MKIIGKYLPTAAVGAVAGFINGLLGAGGGIAVTWYLSAFEEKRSKSEAHACEAERGEKNTANNSVGTACANEVFANAVATMLPICAVSLIIYLRQGYTSGVYAEGILPTAIVGGAIGAYLLTRLRFKIIKTVFALLVTVSGVMMILR